MAAEKHPDYREEKQRLYIYYSGTPATLLERLHALHCKNNS